MGPLEAWIWTNTFGRLRALLLWIWTGTAIEALLRWLKTNNLRLLHWTSTSGPFATLARRFGPKNENRNPGNYALQLRWPQSQRCTGQAGHMSEPGLMSLQCYKNQMLANGWCHHQIEHLSRNTVYGVQTLSYLANLQRSTRLVDHARCLNHLTCVAYNTDSATYETRHIEPGCGCPSVPTPNAALDKIIRNGGVPLISIQESPNGDTPLTIEVSARTIMSKYIAVSHVWADGLGNPTSNALPLCQIKKLRLALSTLHKTFQNSERDKAVSIRRR